MVDDKEHLFDKDEYQRQIKKEMAKLNSQQFANAGPGGLGPEITGVGLKTNIEPISQKFLDVGFAVQDYGTIGFVSQNIDFDLLGAKYNIFDLNGDVTFGFLNFPLNRAEIFTVDISISTMTPPVITWPATVKNLPPSLPTADGSRYILHFLGYRDDNEERYEVIGGFGGGEGASNIIFQDDSKVEVLDDGVAEGRVEVTTDGTALHMRIGLVGGQKTINIESSELTNVNVLRSPTTNQNIDSISGGWRYEVPTGGAVHQFRVHNGTVFVEVGHFDAGGLNMDDLNISNVSGINFSETGVSINDTATNMELGVPADKSVILSSGGGNILLAKLDGGQKTLDFQSSEIINFNVMFSGASGSNKRIDSVVGGFSFDTPFGQEHQFRVRNSGDTAWVNVGTFDQGGFKGENLPIAEIASISFTNAGAISNSATNMTFGIGTGDIFRNTIGGFLELELTATKIDIDAKYLELESIASPGVTGSATIGRMFMNSGNSEHLSIIRNGSVIDLEAGGGAFADNVFEIFDDITSSKKLTFSLATATGTNLFAIFGTTDTYIFPNGGGSVIMSQGNQTIGGTKTFTGFVDLQGNVDLGNSISDLISFEGRFDTDLVPSTNNARSFGTSALTIKKMYMSTSGSARLKIPVGSDLFDT